MTTGGIATYYNLGLNNSATDLTNGPDGAIWFTNGTKIGRITTSGSVTSYSISGLAYGSGAKGITVGPDGNIWFGVQGNSNIYGGKIGKLTTSGLFTLYSLPSANAHIQTIISGPDGNIWFTESGANKIGKITTSGFLTEYTVPTASAGPQGITVGPDDALWFTEQSKNKIGRITTAGTFTEYNLPNANSGPNQIIKGSDDALWFSETGATDRIGRMVAVMKGQSLIFTSSAPSEAIIDGPSYTPSATSTSGLAVTITIDITSVDICTITSGVVSFQQAGMCTLNANQEGDSNYNPASQVQQSFVVAPVESDTSVNLACPPTAIVSDTVTCTVTVSNNGGADARGVTLTVLFSESLTNASLSNGGLLSGQVLTWAAPLLAVGTSSTLSFEATASLVSRASISASLLQVNPDSNISNNVIDAKIKVNN
jgi:uncharacterized repeat protein (TIGR01451 family)